MSKLYELSYEIQIRRVRRTAIACLIAGSWATFSLVAHHQKLWAALIAIVTTQAVIGSVIMIADLRRDIKDRDENHA
jgi:predicted membrane channel-forming protein YqfA (hemolysin III family)